MEKKWTSKVVCPTPWTIVCKCCGAVVPKARIEGGPGWFCSKCGGYTVA